MSTFQHSSSSIGKDLVLVCKDDSGTLNRRFYLQKHVVCFESEYFAHLCNEAEGNEKHRPIEIDLPDEDPKLVARMASYFNTGEYDDEADNETNDLEFVTLSVDQHSTSSATEMEQFEISVNKACTVQLENIAMYALAHKYNIPKLKHLAKSRFEAKEWTAWANPTNCALMLEAVYTTTPETDRGLRDVIIERFTEKGTMIVKDVSAYRILLGLQQPALVEVLLGMLESKYHAIHELTARATRAETELQHCREMSKKGAEYSQTRSDTSHKFRRNNGMVVNPAGRAMALLIVVVILGYFTYHLPSLVDKIAQT